MRRRLANLLALAAMLPGAVVGCGPSAQERAASSAANSYFAADYAAAAGILRPLAAKTDENFALNNARLGSIYLPEYRLDDAEAALLNAYEVMNSLGVNQGGRSVGAVLIDEKIKVWKGEPFERAMASFYLGLTYYMRADYDNARGAFENALFRLRDYESEKAGDKRFEELESNFALARIMLGRCHQRLGDDARAADQFELAVKSRPYLRNLADPALHKRSNVLLVVDYGYGPRRNTEFDGSVLAFKPTPQQAGPIPAPRVIVDGRDIDIRGYDVPPNDLLALAQDRTWQSIDTLRAVKSGIGTGLLAGGAVMGVKGANESGARQRTDLIVAGSLLAVGALLKATSQADVREWEMLPRATYLLPVALTPGRHDITVAFPDAGQTWTGLVAPEVGRERTYYIRVQRFVSGPYAWPPPALIPPPSPTGG